jgi:hypothetical protein
MKNLILLFVFILSVTACGTIKGTLDATGSVLEGVATDARGLGSLFD